MRDLQFLRAGMFFERSREERSSHSFTFAERTALLPEREVPQHTHEEAHFVLIVRGQYLSGAVGSPDVCATSSLIFNPRGTSHRDRFKCDDGVFFTIGLSDEIAKLVESRRPRASFFMHHEVVTPARRALREFRDDDPFTAIVLEGLGLELAGRAATHCQLNDQKAPPWLLRARDFLSETGEPRSVQDAAREAGVHPVHLARAFRRYFDSSPGEYQRRCRVERARMLLESTRLPLTEVALTSGFAAQSDLTRAFRRAFGTTPAAHRRFFQR